MFWIGLYREILLVQYLNNNSDFYLEFCDCTNMFSGFDSLCITPFTLFTSVSNSRTINKTLLEYWLCVSHVFEFNIFQNRIRVSTYV